LPPVSNRKRSALRSGTESGRKPLETNSKQGRIEGKVCPFAPPSLQNRQKKLRIVVYGAFFYCVSTNRVGGSRQAPSSHTTGRAVRHTAVQTNRL
jgi:hypothetical protein